jgi:hypothetical protein
MADFITGHVLFLMAIPLTMATLLGVFIVVSLRRRGQKSKMKLGIAPKQSPLADETPAKADVAAVTPPKTSSPPTSTENWLNFNIFNKPATVEKENSAMAEIPEAYPSEPINLAARLGRQETGSLPVQPSQVSGLSRTSGQEGPGTPPAQPRQTETSALSPKSELQSSLEPLELLRLLRHPESGQLIVEVGGQRYTRLAEVTDKKIGQYILKLAAHFLVFTNGVILASTGMKSIGMPKTDEVPEPILAPQVGAVRQAPPPPAAPLQPLPGAEATLLASLQTTPIEPASTPKSRGFFSRGASSPSIGRFPGLNLAQEINDIVQARLRYSTLAQNRVEITADPGGGIRIQVNHKFYSSPDDIEEPEIKELIKSSIKEWERK